MLSIPRQSRCNFIICVGFISREPAVESLKASLSWGRLIGGVLVERSSPHGEAPWSPSRSNDPSGGELIAAS